MPKVKDEPEIIAHKIKELWAKEEAKAMERIDRLIDMRVRKILSERNRKQAA